MYTTYQEDRTTLSTRPSNGGAVVNQADSLYDYPMQMSPNYQATKDRSNSLFEHYRLPVNLPSINVRKNISSQEPNQNFPNN